MSSRRRRRPSLRSLCRDDFSGRLLTETDAMGRTIGYQYTVDDHLSNRHYSDSATPDVTYAYDAWFPRRTSRVDGTGTTTFAYQPYGMSTFGAGRLSLENGPLADDTLKRTYDELGRLKKLEIVDDATQSTVTFSEAHTFDTRARVTGVQNNLGASPYSFVGQSGRPSTVSYSNGMQILYDYYAATGDFLLKQIKNLSAGSTPNVISQFDYTTVKIEASIRGLSTKEAGLRRGRSATTVCVSLRRQRSRVAARCWTRAITVTTTRATVFRLGPGRQCRRIMMSTT